MTTRTPTVLCLLVLLIPVAAQAGQSQNSPSAPSAVDDVDLDPNPSQPDFTVINLPTTLRLPRFKGAFRVTHRFTRALGQGDVGELAENLFGMDTGAVIGLEYRFGLMRGWQTGVLRTSDRTIQLFTQYNVLDQRSGAAVGLGVLGSIDGTNNFRDRYTPALGVAISREFGDHGAVYVEPMWVNNANIMTDELTDEEDDDAFIVGLAARLRIRPTVYLLGEFVPRVAGYSAGAHHAAFSLEKRAGGHAFQLNFSNGFGNTVGQLTRGGSANDDWYLGFNISRKFY